MKITFLKRLSLKDQHAVRLSTNNVWGGGDREKGCREHVEPQQQQHVRQALWKRRPRADRHDSDHHHVLLNRQLHLELVGQERAPSPGRLLLALCRHHGTLPTRQRVQVRISDLWHLYGTQSVEQGNQLKVSHGPRQRILSLSFPSFQIFQIVNLRGLGPIKVDIKMSLQNYQNERKKFKWWHEYLNSSLYEYVFWDYRRQSGEILLPACEEPLPSYESLFYEEQVSKSLSDLTIQALAFLAMLLHRIINNIIFLAKMRSLG